MVKLGITGLEASPIGFGGIPLQRNSEAEASRIVRTAVDKGINFFDSARGYTDSEHKIGLGLQGVRGNVVLATKSMARTARELASDIDTSLREFATDYIDIYQCHNVRSAAELSQLLGPKGGCEALIQAQADGKIGHIGITGHKPEVVLQAIQQFPFATVQFPYNFLEQQNKDELIKAAKTRELGIIIMKPLAGGAIRKADLALRFLLGQELGVIIPGMDSLAQVQQNTDLVQPFIALTEAERQELAADVAGLASDFCRRCEYCLPCPVGIHIPSMFLFEGYYTRYNLPEWALERYAAAPVKASECIKCGQCEEKCPYTLPIRDKLAKVHSLLGL